MKRTKEELTAIRSNNRRFQRYRKVFTQMFNEGYTGLRFWKKEVFLNDYRIHVEADASWKKLTKERIKDVILNSRTETLNELRAAYDNLANYYDVHKYEGSKDPIVKIINDHGGLLTKDEWIRTQGGNIYKELKAQNLADEALGSD